MGKYNQYRTYKKMHSDGYLMTYLPTHNRASDGYVFDHIIKAENILGKPLKPGTVIHHHSPEQLVICENNGYHMILHRRTRMLQLCGHANWRWCRVCKTFDSPENMIFSGHNIYHKRCLNKYDRERQNKAYKKGRENDDGE